MEQRNYSFSLVTADRWEDFRALFGDRGACGGCWCMHWRVTAAEFKAGKGAGNRRAMKRLIESGSVPGILAYLGSTPVGWCCIGPRGDFPRLNAARTLKPIDGRPVWSIVCLFVAKDYRSKGISTALISAAVDRAIAQGATIVEGYPYDYRHKDQPSPPPFVWTGLIQSFERAGFVEVARPSKTRAIMRRYV